MVPIVRKLIMLVDLEVVILVVALFNVYGCRYPATTSEDARLLTAQLKWLNKDQKLRLWCERDRARPWRPLKQDRCTHQHEQLAIETAQET